jgi:hypothetical protein
VKVTYLLSQKPVRSVIGKTIRRVRTCGVRQIDEEIRQ